MKWNQSVTLVTLAIVALAVLPATVFASGTQQLAATGELADIGFRATGYPIVDTPVEMHAIIQRAPHMPVPFAEMTLLNEVEDRTNVRIVWEEIPSTQVSERVNLMFAAREFPDVFFNAGVSDQNLYTAGRGGDIYPLNEYIEQYAPNWNRVFIENPLLERSVTFPDGNIYSLPYAREIIGDYMIRDVEFINTDWLERVGMSMPETLDEFTDVLRAFRRGIDNGTLPGEGIPWYFRFRQTANGGKFALYGYFGLYVYDQTFLSVNNGMVEYAATDPKITDVMDYLHGLYRERLIVEEAFTDTHADFVTKSNSIPPMLGAFGRFSYGAGTEPYFGPLAPLRVPGVDEPVFRSQQVRVQKNQFTVMRGFAYPEVAVRFIDEFADPLTALQMSYGRLGHEILETADGYEAVGVSEEYIKHAPHNFIAAFIPRSITETVDWGPTNIGIRGEYVERIYGPYVWPQERHFPLVMYTDEEREELSVLQTEITEYVNSTHARWIVEGGVRREWDTYLEQLNRLGLPRKLEIQQAAVDRFYGSN